MSLIKLKEKTKRKADKIAAKYNNIKKKYENKIDFTDGGVCLYAGGLLVLQECAVYAGCCAE